jgi:hypothetical protein
LQRGRRRSRDGDSQLIPGVVEGTVEEGLDEACTHLVEGPDETLDLVFEQRTDSFHDDSSFSVLLNGTSVLYESKDDSETHGGLTDESCEILQLLVVVLSFDGIGRGGDLNAVGIIVRSVIDSVDESLAHWMRIEGNSMVGELEQPLVDVANNLAGQPGISLRVWGRGCGAGGNRGRCRIQIVSSVGLREQQAPHPWHAAIQNPRELSLCPWRSGVG